MKFRKFIEYNMRNNLFEKSFTKSCREASPKPFLRNQK